MAKTLSEEEIQLRKRARRRLVGAIVLVAVAVVVLPMVLDSKPEQRNHEIEIHIPSEDAVDELPPQPAALPEAPAAGVPDSGAPDSPRQESSLPQTSSPAQSSAKAAGKDKLAASGAGPVTAPGAESAGSARTTSVAADIFVVQLGAFSDPAKARQQLQSLASKEKDIKAYTETIKTGKGTGGTGSRGSDSRKEADDNEITRVRAGPFRTREEAEVLRERLRKLGFEGVVTDK
jgi:DedD protein